MKTSLLFTAILLFAFVFVGAQISCLPEGIHFDTQEQIDSFQINYPGCTQIEGDVGIVCIGSSCGEITNLEGLNMVTSIGGHLLIWGNPDLTSLEGLRNLTAIEGNLEIGIYFTFYTGNAVLTSLTGLENLASIGGDLQIYGNDALISLTGLENLTSIGGWILIQGNESLAAMTGLNKVESGTIKGLAIIYNPALSTCNIESVCDYLAIPGGEIHIYDNTTGCNSIEDVKEACDAQGIGDHNLQSLTLHPNPTDNGSITLTLDNLHNHHLSCFNTFGQQVHKQEITGNETVINVSTWAPGIYLAVVVEDGKVVGRNKFVVR